MPDWRLILTPKSTGPANMEHDSRLFHDFEKALVPSTLRIYSWRPNCISLGYAQKEEKLIEGQKARALGWDVVKRPTGGGIVFHNEAEVTYSLMTELDNPLFPKGLVPSYKKISEAIVFALAKLGIAAQIVNPKSEILNKSKAQSSKTQNHLCFSFPAEYEVVANGRKIVGSAQKRGKRTLLQQGSIFVRRGPEEIYAVLKQPGDDSNAISVEEVLGRIPTFEDISEAIVAGFKERLDVKFA